jgi:hypothetical protein
MNSFVNAETLFTSSGNFTFYDLMVRSNSFGERAIQAAI